MSLPNDGVPAPPPAPFSIADPPVIVADKLREQLASTREEGGELTLQSRGRTITIVAAPSGYDVVVGGGQQSEPIAMHASTIEVEGDGLLALETDDRGPVLLQAVCSSAVDHRASRDAQCSDEPEAEE